LEYSAGPQAGNSSIQHPKISPLLLSRKIIFGISMIVKNLRSELCALVELTDEGSRIAANNHIARGLHW